MKLDWTILDEIMFKLSKILDSNKMPDIVLDLTILVFKVKFIKG